MADDEQQPIEVTLEGTVVKALAQNLTTFQEHIPDSIKVNARTVTEVNLSFNELDEKFLPQLLMFPNVTTIVLDNNDLTTLQGFPTLPSLHTLWLNNNQISDIQSVVTTLPSRCPQLKFLSLLRNPCCPNELLGMGQAEYRRYRLYVRFCISTLQILDAAPFSPEDVKEAREKGRFMHTAATATPPAVVSPTSNPNSGLATPPPETGTATPEVKIPLVNNGFVPADKLKFKNNAGDNLEPNKGDGKARIPLHVRCDGPYYFTQRHFYSGKASEGNRFIKDDQL